MHTQNSFVNYCRYWQMIEHGTKVPPKRQIISSLALVVKPVQPSDRVALVIAPQEKNHVRALYFVDQEQAHCFNRLLSSIHEISN